MSSNNPPQPGRGRWQQSTQQAAYSSASANRGRGPRAQGRGTQNARQANPRGRGGTQRGGFTGRGRGGMNVQQMGNSNFQVVRPVGLQQPQFPGSIPSAPTQQVVMVPNHLLQQAVPYNTAAYFQNQQLGFQTQGGMMPALQAQFVHPQQQALLLQQQRANQQNQQQQQANRANQPNAGKPTQPQQTSSPPQQATQPQMNANKIQTPNQSTSNNPSATPIHPMNAQTQPFYVMNTAAVQQGFPANAYFVRRQQPQVMNAAMMANPALLLQQQQAAAQHAALLQHHARVQAQAQQQQRVNPTAASMQQQGKEDSKQPQQTQVINAAMMANPALLMQQQQAAQHAALLQHQARVHAQQQQQQRVNPAAASMQQQQGKEDPKQKQPNTVNYMVQNQNAAMFPTQQQVRMGGPMPPMAMAPQANVATQNPWNMASFQQRTQQQPKSATQASRPPTGITPVKPQVPSIKQPNATPTPAKQGMSKPPTSGLSTQPQPTAGVHAEMMKKFQEVARTEKKPASPGANSKKGGTPLSAKAAVFVPGSFTGASDKEKGPGAAPSQPPAEVNKKDPAIAPTPPVQMIPPTVIPTTSTMGVPAEQANTQTSKPPVVVANVKSAEGEEKVMQMFDPSGMNKVQQENNVGPKEMAALVSETTLESGMSDVLSEDVHVTPDKSSPRSNLSLDPVSETGDDDNEEDAKEDVFDVENRIYTIAQLVKLAKDPDCRAMHDVLSQSKYNSIKAPNAVIVQEIIESNRMNRRRRQPSFQGGGVGRDIFGTKKPKKNKTPKGKNQRHGPKGKYDNYPPLLRVEPLAKDMNNSWWATHRQKNSPLDLIRKKSLALLNKLTLENKSTICGQFTDHIQREVKSIDECNVVVSTIFEKSCAESKFSNLYADLCHVVQSNLSGVKPNLEREQNPESVKENEDMKSLFRRSIINLCQLNFNKRLSSDAIEGSDEEIMTQLDNTKRKMMGNIKFIGDLFKHKLIHESIVHHIIAKLLTPRDKDYDSNSISRRKLDDQLEGCCRLLQTVGKQIDVPKAKEWIDQYFDYMIHYQKNAQNRIHFMVLEIKELRGNRWIPRREVETVKLKEEVRKEFEREQMEKQRGPKRKHGVKVTAKRPGDFRGRHDRRETSIRGSTQGHSVWGRNRTPSSAPVKGKKGSQDIRGSGFSNARSPNNASQPPSSAPRPSRQTSSPADQMKALQKKWSEFGSGKKIDDKQMDKFLLHEGSPVATRLRWQVFFRHFIGNAMPVTQKQMMTTLRQYLRIKKVNHVPLMQALQEIGSQVEELGDEFDAPKAAEYYGYILSEPLVTGVITPQQLVTSYIPQKVEKETLINQFMTGVLTELSKLDDPNGTEFIEKHASALAKGFRLKPKNYGKVAKRTCIPTVEELAVIQVVLGESAV